MLRTLLCCALLMWLTGCQPEPPEKERPPEPQAAASGLNDAIQAPLDKARAVEGQVQESAETQRAAIDEAAGG